jgi:two-component system sensor histidine kinase/response regulator
VVQDVMGVLMPQAKQKNLEVIVTLDRTTILSDADILAIAIRNIVTNAIKFSKDGGMIRLDGVSESNNYVLSIQDYGMGMTESQVEEILQRKNTTSTEGTTGESGHGLGMFLVLQLLQKVNVPLRIKSNPGEGSQFLLTFETMA